MTYAEQVIQKYTDYAKKLGYEILEQTNTRIQFNDFMHIETHEIVVSLVDLFAEQLPDHECSVLRSENLFHVTYRLELKKENHLLKWEYVWKKEGNILKFWDYQKGEHTDIKQQFKDAVEAMPEFRLRLLTGDLKLKKSK